MGGSKNSNPESFLRNCNIQRSKNDKSDYLFYKRPDGTITAHLDGYAVIPIEEYNKLKDARH